MSPTVPRPRESASKHTHDIVFRLLAEHLRTGRVFDIPCGSGAFLERARKAGYEVYGGDLDALPSVPAEAFRYANMNERLPFEDASLDAVVSIEGIEHIERPFDFVGECLRVLRPGGCFILTTPDISSIRSRWRWLLTGFHNKGKYPLDETHPQPRHHINLLSFPQLRYMLHTRGARIEKIETNRIKPANWLYVPLLPLLYLATRLALPKGIKNPAHATVTREVMAQMMSRPVLFGESLILLLRKEPGNAASKSQQ